MNVWDGVNYLLGYVSFSVTGVNCEGFLNEVMKNNLDVWAIKRVDSVTLKAKTRLNGYREVEKAAELSKTELEQKKLSGLPKLLSKYRFRYGILAGAAIFLLLVAAMSLFIWDVEVVGATGRYETDRILEILEDSGFHRGSFIPAQDKGALKRKIMQEFSTVAGVTVNIFGTNALVEVSPAILAPENVAEGAKSNLVAKTDGQLVLVEAYRGSPVVKVGDAVKKGDLLVSGVYNSKIMGERLVHARGKILARTLKTLERAVAYSESEDPEADARQELSFAEKIEIKNIQVEDKGERVIKTDEAVTVIYYYVVIEDIGEDLEILTGE